MTFSEIIHALAMSNVFLGTLLTLGFGSSAIIIAYFLMRDVSSSCV